ncbi:DNA-binding transcriptional response regulator, NtrC family, contains REC, AAA-type ATPase, and a Fis-type DNA-binding domains [Variovorax sp. HW608]|uniref:sigma-54 dependent transcriptional regulator n=1 Tax=Variovorax sp. HW608 TaxID=1034889 RepID=UPI00081F8B36|nr:sigma-54 dependent transcriptional regulator [Variovorax sp. HW608]SCK52945.1 DNA-binding transcriptional response regulator, NtrC family, contains REC, AAA-type ATPase, and a Fis-type DNA-binding domains [Variovorax sp. HW608]
MQPGSILCVTLGGDATQVLEPLIARGWDVTQASDLVAAGRMQAHRHFKVGVLIVGTSLNVPEAAVEACVNASPGSEWVSLCETEALEHAGFRELVLGCFFDHQVMPVDLGELEMTLQHADQRALLRLRHDAAHRHAVDALGMVGQGPAITRLRQQIRKVAATDAPVLIGGESGSGKELAARAIHQCSQRSAGPFVAVNCGAISPNLIQSELFGHERGAFTGASSERRGLIEAANGGTIFLDEIGDLPIELQTNLLRFLQEKTISRVGAVRNLHVDVRVVAASHVDLAEAVAVGQFRDDLFYRLNVLSIEVAPLRRRMEDVPILAEYFFQRCAAKSRARVKGFSRQAVAAMLAHAWPGNVRELFNRVQRAVVMTDRRLIGPADLGLAPADNPVGMGLDAARTVAERDAIVLTLTRVGRNITHAARELGVSRMTLYRLMDKHSIALDSEIRPHVTQPWPTPQPTLRTAPAAAVVNPLETVLGAPAAGFHADWDGVGKPSGRA